MIRSHHLVQQSARRLAQSRNVVQQKQNFWSGIQLFKAPKGFERYFRKPGDKKAPEAGEPKQSTEQPSSKQSQSTQSKDDKSKQQSAGGPKKSDSSKSGGGKKIPDGFDPERNMKRVLIATGVFGVIALGVLDEMKNGREISWQDFQKQLLESGQVDRIVVTNKNIARVILRSSSSQSDTLGNNQPGNNQPAPGEFGWTTDAQSGGSTPVAPAAPADGTPGFARYPTLGVPANSASSPYFFNIGTVETFERKLEDAQRSLGIAPKDFIPVMYVSETSWTSEILRFLPTAMVIGAMFFMMRGAVGGMGGGSGGPGGIFKIGKSNAKRVTKEQVTTSFKDVAGCDEAKKEIMEFVHFLKDPKKYTDLGARIPKGALLCGPPGTGKTMLAKATAGEANVPFFSISGSDFVEMFVGVGPSRVRDLFKEARESAPCIIFIDEIDAVGRQRGRGGFSGSNDERENTLNQLLVEMDGFDASANVVILAGTNRIDILDSALTRPGRFDRQISVDRPDIAGRKQIFDVYLKNLKLDDPSDSIAGRLAALTPGFVGADIANICNEAAIIAARRDKAKVDITDFEAATDRVIGGLESKKIMSPEEKKIVAYHEAGHAIAGWHLEHADPLLKVTIVPRGSGALGFAQYLPKELFLRTRDQLLDMVCMALAGRASEQVHFGRVTTGASDDLRRVTQILYQMVQVYGMNEKVGQVAFPKEEGGFPGDKMYSNATAELIDQEVRALVDDAYKRTVELITEKSGEVVKIAQLLIEKETITNGDIAALIGSRPFSAGKDYEQYVNAGWKKLDPAVGPAQPAAEELTVGEGAQTAAGLAAI